MKYQTVRAREHKEVKKKKKERKTNRKSTLQDSKDSVGMSCSV